MKNRSKNAQLFCESFKNLSSRNHSHESSDLKKNLDTGGYIVIIYNYSPFLLGFPYGSLEPKKNNKKKVSVAARGRRCKGHFLQRFHRSGDPGS